MSTDEIIRSWRRLDGEALLKAVLSARSLKTAVLSSFGAESAVLLDMVARIDPATPVIFVDTGKLFAETLAYRDTLTKHLKLSDVRTAVASPALVNDADPHGDLYRHDADACCHVRKVMPYAMAASAFDVLINGRKRHHGFERDNIDVVEQTPTHIKVNPLAHCDGANIEDAFVSRNLPRHPLAGAGYPSIGCQSCTHQTCPSRGVRAGRWANHDKTECGIHKPVDFEFQGPTG